MADIVALLAKFRLKYPEFSTVDDTTVNFWLQEAIDCLSESAWGDCYEKAVIAYAAHLLALSQLRISGTQIDDDGNVVVQQTGVIANASADGLSVGFAQNAGVTGANDVDALLQQTPYGQEYLSLKRRCLSRGRVAAC